MAARLLVGTVGSSYHTKRLKRSLGGRDSSHLDWTRACRGPERRDRPCSVDFSLATPVQS